MFLCACGKYSGPWNKFESFLTPKQNKKECRSEDNKSYVKDLQKSTTAISSLNKEVFSEILEAFSLPVGGNLQK